MLDFLGCLRLGTQGRDANGTHGETGHLPPERQPILSSNPPPSSSSAAYKKSCVFCDVTSEKGFSIVWENDTFVAFNDRSPAATHHIQLVPKAHIGSVKELGTPDVPMLRTMEEIGHQILASLDVPPSSRRLGFHIPPFNSIQHLHLHLQGLPYKSVFHALGFPGKSMLGINWFIEIGEACKVLERGEKIRVIR